MTSSVTQKVQASLTTANQHLSGLKTETSSMKTSSTSEHRMPPTENAKTSTLRISATSKAASTSTTRNTENITATTDVPENFTGNETMHATNTHFSSYSTYSSKYLILSIISTIAILFEVAIVLLIWIRRRKYNKKKIFKKPPVLRPKIHKQSNIERIEMKDFSTNDDYLKPFNSIIYRPTVQPMSDSQIYEDVS